MRILQKDSRKVQKIEGIKNKEFGELPRMRNGRNRTSYKKRTSFIGHLIRITENRTGISEIKEGLKRLQITIEDLKGSRRMTLRVKTNK